VAVRTSDCDKAAAVGHSVAEIAHFVLAKPVGLPLGHRNLAVLGRWVDTVYYIETALAL